VSRPLQIAYWTFAKIAADNFECLQRLPEAEADEDDQTSASAFAGPDATQAAVEPGALSALHEFDAHVCQHELLRSAFSGDAY
jgi:hypothetical protein